MPELMIPPTARFNKTELGRQEIRARACALSRSARNLLLILDDTRPVAEWLMMVQGASLEDLADLVRAHLVVPLQGRLQAPAPRRPPAPLAAVVRAPLSFAGVSYADLYAALNAMVHAKLGLVQSYRFAQDIERAAGLEELAEVARRFVDEVHKAHGDAAARHVKQALRLRT